MLFDGIDVRRLRHDIASASAQCLALKRVLRVRWTRPMADEQKPANKEKRPEDWTAAEKLAAIPTMADPMAIAVELLGERIAARERDEQAQAPTAPGEGS